MMLLIQATSDYFEMDMEIAKLKQEKLPFLKIEMQHRGTPRQGPFKLQEVNHYF